MRNSKLGAVPWKLIALGVVIAALIGLSFIFPVREYIKEFLDWTESLGALGFAVFAAVYILATVLFAPGSPLTLGAGVIFGLPIGFLAVVVGSNVGAWLAFLIGRYFARDAIARKVEGNARFEALDKAVGDQGWKIVLLTRLSPVFPFNLLNYAYGLTRVSFFDYAWATLVGMIPGTLLYVYFGTLAGDVAEAAAGEAPTGGPLQTVFKVVGLLATLVVTIYITKIARRALSGKLEQEKPGAVKEGGEDSSGENAPTSP